MPVRPRLSERLPRIESLNPELLLNQHLAWVRPAREGLVSFSGPAALQQLTGLLADGRSENYTSALRVGISPVPFTLFQQ